MEPGRFLTFWTARAALTFYVLALGLRTYTAARTRWLVWARFMWTTGCMLFVAHVFCAFEYFHHWSHAAAYVATARQTAETVGLNWGGGVYVNYVFALVWLSDVCWWWLAPESYLGRHPATEWIIQGFLSFIAFNATVVFGQPAVRWCGLTGTVFLATLFVLNRVRRGRERR